MLLDKFLGEPVSYWIELQRRLNENTPPEEYPTVKRLICEVAELNAKLSFYERRVYEMNIFREENSKFSNCYPKK